MVDELIELLRGRRVVALTGAGCSTESGIPDYRGPSGASRRHSPMTYQTFVGDRAARHRYWARSFLGWRQIAQARPNAGHRAVAELQRGGLVDAIITQNVDGLHQAAGARDVVELHGGLNRVLCLACGRPEPRLGLDARLQAANRAFTAAATAINPDGDAALEDRELAAFRMVDCLGCGEGPLKPDVVFFGENVPKPRVDQCYRAVEAAGALLVLGSSLTVLSGFRFVRHAAKRGIPVAIVNQGPTRADELADVRLDAPLGETLTALAAGLATEPVASQAGAVC